jgi:hypothetical protein
MTFVQHKWRYAGTYYYQLGSYKVHETDVARMWELMCGEKAIKQFLARCEKERPGSDQVVPVLKDRSISRYCSQRRAEIFLSGLLRRT